MNVLIPAQYVDQVRAITDRGYIVIDPAGHINTGTIRQWDRWGKETAGGRYAASTARLPSPWCDLPDTCQTCRGKGRRRYLIPFDPRGRATHWDEEPCPDCVAGHPVHLLQASCPTCNYPDEDCYACDHCHDTCRVDLGRFTVQIVPVMLKDIHGEPPDAYVYVLAAGRSFLCRGDHEEQLPLDPPPQPGQFVAEFVRQP